MPYHSIMANKQTGASMRFRLSVMLILFSLICFFIISYKALSFQSEYLSRQTQTSQYEQLDQISRAYFRELKNSLLPYWAVPLPVETPAFPGLMVPETIYEKEVLIKSLIYPEKKLVLLTEAELNAPAQKQDFWRFLLFKQYLENKNFFQARKVASRILNSSFDYLLPEGLTLKTKTALLAGETFIKEENPNAFLQWIYRLRSLPMPLKLPKRITELFSSSIPEESEEWLRFLGLCYEISKNGDIQPGWHSEKTSDIFVCRHMNGLAGFPAGPIINNLKARFSSSGFSKIVSLSINDKTKSAHALSGSDGLFVKISRKEPKSITGSFLLIFILMCTGILGLISFALYEWQFAQKQKLLQEEENFFRQTAHDVKTPLTTVRFLAETLSLKRYKSPEQQQRYLNQLLSESEKAAELVDQLLLSVRLKKQSVHPQVHAISPRFRISDVLRRLKPRTQNWEIVEDYQTNVEIKADPDMFERAMINLIENALKHAQNICRLQIRVSLFENQVEIEVIDCGRGIEDFFNGNETVDLLRHSLPYNSSRGGSGIGLLLVKQIIQLHEGQFLVRKNQGTGLAMITRWKAAENG